MKIFETPILAPGRIMGGNKLSIVKAIVASAENRPQSEILITEFFFMLHPVIGGTKPSSVSGTIFKLCGAQYIEPDVVIFGE